MKKTMETNKFQVWALNKLKFVSLHHHILYKPNIYLNIKWIISLKKRSSQDSQIISIAPCLVLIVDQTFANGTNLHWKVNCVFFRPGRPILFEYDTLFFMQSDVQKMELRKLNIDDFKATVLGIL